MPLTKVDVVVRHQRLNVTALVDSGADRCVVPRGIVEALKVDFEKLPLAMGTDGNPVRGLGAGGEFEMRQCRGKIRWRTSTVSDSFWVGPDSAVPWVLLGRDDFFAKYDVTFRWSTNPPIMEFDKVD